jgi:hypothetical protein
MINPNEIQIDYSYSYRTYAGVLDGGFGPKALIAKARIKAEDLWGPRPTLLIDPGIKTSRFPEWTHMVWASGPALTEENDGSTLVIIWFSEMSPDTDRVLQAVEWAKYAEDFRY